jgi:D-inositol-3-phosphate glycosyltransferase
VRIAIVADRIGPRPVGSRDAYPADPTLRILSLAAALARLGPEVTVFTGQDAAEPGPEADRRSRPGRGPAPDRGRTPGQTAKRSGVTTERLAAGPDFTDGLAARWRRAAPDVIHACSPAGALAALPAARELGIPVVLSTGLVPPGPLPADPVAADPVAADPVPASQAAMAEVGAAVDALLVGTSAELAGSARLGAPRSAIRLVPPGVDTGRFCPSGPVARRGNRPRLLVITDLAGRPALAVVLRALAGFPAAELVIAGGPARTRLTGDPGHAALDLFGRRLGLRDRLTFTGALTQAAAPALLRSADVLLSLTAPGPATTGPFATVPLEAMACGIPVIASAAGLQRDAIIDGSTGFLVPPVQPARPGVAAAQLARRLRELLASPMLLEGCGIAAACRARDRYSWERIGRETLACYESLAGPHTETAA